jgi:TPR repeat protein
MRSHRRLTWLMVFLFTLPTARAQVSAWHASVAEVTVSKNFARAPGSAFVVAIKDGAAYLLTAAHVVEGDPQPQVIFEVDTKNAHKATIEHMEDPTEKSALAILKVLDPPLEAIALTQSDQVVSPGTKVQVGGFSAQWGTFVPYEDSATRSGRDLLLPKTDLGYSGGPVVFDGAALGMIYGDGKALDSASLRSFLEGNDLQWAYAKGGPPNPYAAEKYALAEELFHKHDIKAALDEGLIAAALDNRDAMILIGQIYLYGKGDDKLIDEAKARYWLQKAGEKGGALGYEILAAYYHFKAKVYNSAEQKSNDEVASQFRKRAAEAGSVESMDFLADLYFYGLYGNPLDYSAALEWYQKAAHLGDARAMNAVGEIYLRGSGVPPDRELALRWFKRAAAAGDATAQDHLKAITK